MFEYQNRLDQTGETTSRLCVTDIGLHRAYIQVMVSWLLREDIGQGLNLSDVARLGTSTMRLNEWSFGRVEVKIMIHPPDQSLLGIWVRECYAIGLSILVCA